MPLRSGALVRAVFDAFNQASTAHIATHWHEDAVWTPSVSGGFEQPEFRGHEGIARYTTERASVWRDFRQTIEALDTEGSSVVVRVRIHAVGLGSGVTID